LNIFICSEYNLATGALELKTLILAQNDPNLGKNAGVLKTGQNPPTKNAVANDLY
jgi:hypothetical protein